MCFKYLYIESRVKKKAKIIIVKLEVKIKIDTRVETKTRLKTKIRVEILRVENFLALSCLLLPKKIDIKDMIFEKVVKTLHL